MSLGGIAIAIGAMIDAAIVMIENAHKHLERAEPGKPSGRGADRGRIRGRPGAVLQPADHHRVLPADLALEGQEGRLFGPLAATKTFAMAARRSCR
jgi:Cu(I)/Ag(I) efflux system membrane protein CusA/SilA